MDDEYSEKRRIRRRNHINKDLRDLRGPFSPKVIPGKKKEPYKREKLGKDYNIEDDEE